MGGSIQKLTIGTYKDSNYETRILMGAFKAFINPAGFSMTYKSSFATDQAMQEFLRHSNLKRMVK